MTAGIAIAPFKDKVGSVRVKATFTADASSDQQIATVVISRSRQEVATLTYFVEPGMGPGAKRVINPTLLSSELREIDAALRDHISRNS